MSVKFLRRLLSCSVLIFCLQNALAIAPAESTTPQDDQAKQPRTWTGSAELGYVGNTGNTSNDSFSGGFNLTHLKDKWQTILNLQALYSADKGKTTSQRVTEQLETKYFFNEKHLEFWYGLVNGAQDKFSAYNPVYSFSVGYGKRLFQTNTMYLDGQIGPGGRFSQVEGTNEQLNEFVVYTDAHYHWDFTKKTAFDQVFDGEFGSINNFIESTTSITTKLVGHLALDLSYNVRYNSHIPSGSKRKYHVDTTSIVSVLYSF